MANKNHKRISREIKQQLFWLSDQELVHLFNQRVGSKSWGTTLLLFVRELLDEMQKRGIDLSLVTKDKNAIFQHAVFLKDNQILRICDFDEEEAFTIISNYLYQKLGVSYEMDEGLIHWTNYEVYFLHKATNTEISFPASRIAKDKDFDYLALLEC